MAFFSRNSAYTGIEISNSHVRAVTMTKRKNEKAVIGDYVVNSLPEKTVCNSFRKQNIKSEPCFHTAMTGILKTCPKNKVAVSIPDSAAKLLIKKYNDLPSDPKEVDEMVRWSVSTQLNVPSETLRISWIEMGSDEEGAVIFLVGLSFEEVMAQYEVLLLQAGLKPLMMAPSSLNRFNFYSSLIPEKGRVAYLGLFDDNISIFAFNDGAPYCYKNVAKGLFKADQSSAIDDFDLLVQYVEAENPDSDIEDIFVASHIKSSEEIELILQELRDARFQLMDETSVIGMSKKAARKTDPEKLALLSSPIGAAVSLMGVN